MQKGDPFGTKTDVWSFGITICVLHGLADICPENYKTGIAGFCKDCANGKNQLLLNRNGIYLSAIIKDLLQNIFMVSIKKRFDMQQVINHKYITMPLDIYTTEYNKWVGKEVPRLDKLACDIKETLGNIREDHKVLFDQMNEDLMLFYCKQNEQGR